MSAVTIDELPALDAACTAVVNRLIGPLACSSVQLGEQPCTWQWQRKRPCTHVLVRIELRTDDDEFFTLEIDQEQPDGIDASVALEPFDGQALCLAAALRYALLLGHLEQLTQRRWRCVAVLRSALAEPQQANAVQCGFSVRRHSDNALCITGSVHLPRQHLQAWQRAGARPALAPAWRNALPIKLGLWLQPPPPFGRDELRRLDHGSAIVIGRAAAQGWQAALRLPGQRHEWPLWLTHHQLIPAGPPRLVSAAVENTARSLVMLPSPTPSDVPAAAVPAERTTAVDILLETMPVNLQFQIAELTMPLAELSSHLVQGHVMPLGKSLDEQSVSVRANGLEIARGELVQVGDLLAVRISQMGEHGPE